ncbi:MAG: sigma-70 family RNA polymerase sigma factor [Actinobacteria bacterium]|nr:MAG: sigma-70 family RNA polymerase sigma factor [Actinomycetota bacterium]
MERREWLARAFEEQRPHLRAVAYRMLGSLTEADDAVQESWLRLDRSEDTIDDFRAWLTTVVGRICLDVLRARRARPDDIRPWVPEPIVSDDPSDDPEEQAMAADSVSLALLVVLERLRPAERVAFVLHDVFDMPFDDIGRIVGRSAVATRQLASRARRSVRGGTLPAETDIRVQRRVVDAFLAASRSGDFEALLEVLDPDVIFHVGSGRRGTPSVTVTGARPVAERIMSRGSPLAPLARLATVNGSVGAIVGDPEHPIAVVAFTVSNDRIVAIDLVANPPSIRRLDTNG